MKIARAAALAAVLLVVTGLAAADTVMVKKVHSDGLPALGQPASDTTQTTWIGKGRMRMESEQGGFLVLLDQKKAYILDPKAKKAYAIDLPIDFSKIVPAEQAAILEQMKAMKMKVTVVPTEEKKKILKYDARRYDIKLENPMGMTSEIKVWTTNDIKLDLPMLRELVAPLQGLSPMTADLVTEMKKVDGVQIASESSTSMMGNVIRSTEELVSVEEKPAPAGTYEIPAGWTVEPFNLMTSMSNMKM